MKLSTVVLFLTEISLQTVKAEDDIVFVGVVKSVQFQCTDFGKPLGQRCSGKIQVNTKDNKVWTVQTSWNPEDQAPPWLSSTKELTFDVYPLEHTTEYDLVRVHGAD